VQSHFQLVPKLQFGNQGNFLLHRRGEPCVRPGLPEREKWEVIFGQPLRICFTAQKSIYRIIQRRRIVISLSTQVLEKNGKKQFVVLPYEDFLKLQEELAC